MKILKKDNFKFLVIIFAVLLILIITIFFLISLFQYKAYKKDVNLALGNILDIVNKKYPEAEEEIITMFNNKTLEPKTEILDKYGISEAYGTLSKLDVDMNKHLIINSIIFLIFGIILFILFSFYLMYRDRKIKEITNYIEAINKKDYSLSLKDNDESELSHLKNELYKITIMLKEQAENSNKEKAMISKAVSDISHQLKTPLTSMSIMIDNIQNDKLMEEEVKEDFLKEISKQIEWINFLVISLLKLARFDSGVVELKTEKINVKELINKVKNNLSINAELKNVEIKIMNNNNSFFIGDFNWQAEALTNIVKNCIEHTSSGKHVYISYMENNFYTKIIVRDEGVGMNKEDLKNIFKRFYKGQNSSETSIGIGLSLAKTIIESGNGYIKCVSEEDVGTTFEIKYMKN